MLPILKKFKLKDMEDTKLIVNAPEEYYELLDEHEVAYDTEPFELVYDFIQIFGTSNDELLQWASLYIEFLNTDGMFWLMYPKKRSKKYKNKAINRDTVEELLREYQFKPTKNSSFDDDFSGLLFEPVERD